MKEPQTSPGQPGCAPTTTWQHWGQINWAKVNRRVKSLQARIVKAVQSKHFHKARALFHLLVHSFYGKLLAILRVSTNKGSHTPGVDKQIWVTPYARWQAVAQLSVKGYKAKPLKRKTILKKNGKPRHLGIPTIGDRAVQALYKLGLEPMAETTSDLNSYGFRPKRSCADAIEQCHNVLGKRTSAQWIFEADIKGCFDNISHQWVMQHIPIPKRILRQWLKAGYIDNRKWFPTEQGTPQGGVISPTIANMVLDGLEQEIISHACPKRYSNGRYENPLKVHFIRYADDFIVTSAKADYLESEIVPLITKFLEVRGLELSLEKSKITHINDGFDFLGFNIRKYKHKCLTKPKKGSVKDIYGRIRAVVKANKTIQQKQLIWLLRPIIKGWANFYRHSASKKTFAVLDSKVFNLLWNWAKRRHPNKNHHWIKDKYFKQVGNRYWVFASSVKSAKQQLPRFDATHIVRHIKVMSQSNPYHKDWEAYFEQRARKRIANFGKKSKLAERSNDRVAKAAL
jgi:RNA-directed DNA polymerase